MQHPSVKATNALVAFLFLAYYLPMANIIRTLFGLRKGPGGQATPAPAAADPYQPWLEAALASIRQCSSIPDLNTWLAHANGYLREAALGRAVELASPELLAGITSRLNDWVPEVRRAAKNALLTLTPGMPAGALLAQLPAIHRLRSASRENHAAWVDRLELLLLETIGAQAIIEGIHHPAIRVARACFHMAQAHALLPIDTLVRQALASPDICIALDTVGMIAALPTAERHDAYLAALGSSHGAVRTAALRALLAASPSAHAALATSCLFDAQSSVRAAASTYLQGLGIDTDALYIERLKAPEPDAHLTRVCLLALAASGRAEHARIMEEHAGSSAPRVQMAALMGWARLEPSHKDSIAVLALQSPVPRIRKLSLVLIQDFGAYVPIEAAIAMAQAHQDAKLMVRLSRQEPWTWLETIVRIADTMPITDELSAILAQNLLAWSESSGSIYAAPTPKQLELLGTPAARTVLGSLLPRATALHRQIDYTISQARLRQR